MVANLNTVNENVEFDKRKLSEAHHSELEALREETNDRIGTLQDENQAKDDALKGLNARINTAEKDGEQKLIEAQQEAQRRCIALQKEAAAREEELRVRHKKEQKAAIDRLTEELSSQAAKKLEIELNESSKRNKVEIATLQESLKKEQRLALKRQREEMNNRHSDEIYKLKSQHEKTTSQIKVDAAEHEKVEVENAVTLIKAEYEQNKYQQIVEHNQKCQAIKVEVTDRLNAEISRLQNELVEVQNVAQEVPCLRAEICEREDLEKKQKNELRRLQDSLQASTMSNQCIIDGLKHENEELMAEKDEMNRNLNDRSRQITSLKTQVSHRYSSVPD